jgi:hypothetical protein
VSEVGKDRAVSTTPHSNDALAKAPLLEVHARDLGVATVTAAVGIAVIWAGVVGKIPFATALAFEIALMFVPILWLVRQARRGAELTVPTLLAVTTVAGGPVGAAGCTLMAFALWCRRPAPARLREWYDYISGVAARSRAAELYDDVTYGRVPPDATASVHRFAPILSGTSIADQQRVLAVIGHRYHSDLRPVLKRGLRHRNALVRAQAAAVASQLDLDEKTRLWANTPKRVRDAIETEAQGHDLGAKRDLP